jgi:hypothetical protein
MRILFCLFYLFMFSCGSSGGNNYYMDNIEGIWIAETATIKGECSFDVDVDVEENSLYDFDYSALSDTYRGMHLQGDTYWFNFITRDYDEESEENQPIAQCIGGILCEEEGNYNYLNNTLVTCSEYEPFECIERAVSFPSSGSMLLTWPYVLPVITLDDPDGTPNECIVDIEILLEYYDNNQ